MLRKVKFDDGERFNVWVGRYVTGSLVLKANVKIIGSYQVNRLDTTSYDADSKTKPDPVMIVMGQMDSAECSVRRGGTISQVHAFRLEYDEIHEGRNCCGLRRIRYYELSRQGNVPVHGIIHSTRSSATDVPY